MGVGRRGGKCGIRDGTRAAVGTARVARVVACQIVGVVVVVDSLHGVEVEGARGVVGRRCKR